MPSNDAVSDNENSGMQDANGLQPSAAAQCSPTACTAMAKLVYQKPLLHVYGAVHTITAGLAGSGTDAQGMFMDRTMSDCTAKQDIVRIGTHPSGFGLYLFNYKPEFRHTWLAGQGPDANGFRYFGVMAQEVREFAPAAVTESAAGYLQVDYTRLGIALATQPTVVAA